MTETILTHRHFVAAMGWGFIVWSITESNEIYSAEKHDRSGGLPAADGTVLWAWGARFAPTRTAVNEIVTPTDQWREIFNCDTTETYNLDQICIDVEVVDEPIILYTREHEVMLEIITPDGGRCGTCQKDLAIGKFAWDHRITDPMYCQEPEWKLGEDWFKSARPIDGSRGCVGAFQGYIRGDGTVVPDRESYFCYSMPRCPKCRQYNTTVTKQEAYGDDVTCTNCDRHDWYSIGD